MMIAYYFLLFIIYSIIGWILEVIDIFIETKKLINRGFLIGPYCPIYGCGGILVTFLLHRFIDYRIVVFLLSIVICSVVEYFTSYIMEKIFHTRWWDYSKRKCNINGRICLTNMILFGICCYVLVYIINPFIYNILDSIPTNILNIIAIIVAIIFITDIIVSYSIINKFNEVSKNVRKDSTEQITKYVKSVLLKTNKKMIKRVIDSFPRLSIRRK